MKKLLTLLLVLSLFGCKDPSADKKASYKYYIECDNDGFFESNVKFWVNSYHIATLSNGKFSLEVDLDEGAGVYSCDFVTVKEQ